METEQNPSDILPEFGIGPGEIKKSEKVGRYIAATRDIKEGEIIMEEFPIMIAPKYEPQLLWGFGIININNNNSTLKICMSCVKKCKEDCKNCGWPVCDFKCERAYLHSNYECNIFREKNIHPSDFEFDFIAVEVLRYILMKEKDLKGWEQFNRLEANLEARFKDPTTADIRAYVLNFVRNRCGFTDETEESIANVLGKISTNGFSITMNYSRHLSVVFASVSYLAHSCDPNLDVIWGFHPTVISNYDQKYFSIKFYAVRDIKAGESLTHCYFLRPKTLEDRQKCMESNYYFKCDCDKCRVDLFNEIAGTLDFDNNSEDEEMMITPITMITTEDEEEEEERE